MNGLRRFISRYFTILVLLVFVLVASLSTDHFLTLRNALNIALQVTVLGLLALGMSFVILCGHMDLSVGSIMTFCGVVAISIQGVVPAGVAIAAALVMGACIGVVNGTAIVLTRASSGDSLMITFGTLMVLSGVSLVATNGFSLPASPSALYNAIGVSWLARAIPLPVVIFLVATFVLSVVDSSTAFGRMAHMIGYSPEASRLSGLNLARVKITCYTLSGFMAAVGAVILTSRTLGATPTAGDGYEMDAIVAVVLGGTSLSGGHGRVLNTFFGALTLGIIGNTMNLLGFSAFDQMIAKGVLLILAVYADSWNRKQLLRTA